MDWRRLPPRHPRAPIAALLGLAVVVGLAQAAGRSAAVRAEFRHQNPCPSTGKTTGACPSYVIDHRYPLCAGGEDAPRNMQWLTIEEVRGKDAQERRLCRAVRKAAAAP